MSQIKLRRDTSTNFTTANPVLGSGEPAYETDTKKLKIGDGSTAYSNLDYFSSGGGTEFTVVQPLALVDGTLTLQIDEQTIQVQDGKLVANLDELGNEVNDLSGRVTAAEADILNKANKTDLDKKENKITPTGALTLTEKVMSNLNGMSITADGVGAYSTSGTYIDSGRTSWSDSDRIIGSYSISGYFVPGEYTAESWRGGYIDMPYTFGYTMKLPQSAAIYGYAGKYDIDGRFIPIIQVGYSHNGKSILYSDSLTLEKESGRDYTLLRGQASAASGKATYVSTSGGRNNSGWTISDKSYQYLQWYIESNGTITQIRRDGQTPDARFYVATSTSAATEAIERWKEVTVIRFAPTYEYRDNTYGVAANPFPVADFGTYPTDKKIYEYASEADLVATGNLFDISGQTAQNYLELAIGDGLSVKDNKLICTVEAPDAYTKATTDALLADKQDILVGADPITVVQGVKDYTLTLGSSLSNNSGIISNYNDGTDCLIIADFKDFNLDPAKDWILTIGYTAKSASSSANPLMFSLQGKDSEGSYKYLCHCWYGGSHPRVGSSNPTGPDLISDGVVHKYIMQKTGDNVLFKGDGTSNYSFSTSVASAGVYSQNITIERLVINVYNQAAFETIDLNNTTLTQEDKVINFGQQYDPDSKIVLAIGSGLAITDGKLSAVSSGSSVEKYGIEGDYSSKYGILECPNGIFTVSSMTMTLQPGVVMQCAGSESKTTNSSAMAHTVTSTSDFDIFYTSGQFIEATQVVFSTEEPEDGDTGYIAWWDPSREDKKWQFKSNDTGNVWAAAAACRLAHVHTDGTTITRVDYIGNRQMDDSVFVDASTLDGITFKKITQSAYEALATPDANTLYIIVG